MAYVVSIQKNSPVKQLLPVTQHPEHRAVVDFWKVVRTWNVAAFSLVSKAQVGEIRISPYVVGFQAPQKKYLKF